MICDGERQVIDLTRFPFATTTETYKDLANYLSNALAALGRLYMQNLFMCVSLPHKTSVALYRSQSSTNVHQTCH